MVQSLSVILLYAEESLDWFKIMLELIIKHDAGIWLIQRDKLKKLLLNEYIFIAVTLVHFILQKFESIFFLSPSIIPVPVYMYLCMDKQAM